MRKYQYQIINKSLIFIHISYFSISELVIFYLYISVVFTKQTRKNYYKERETIGLQRLSRVTQKFSKKLKTETRTRLHSCAFLTTLQVLVIKHFLWPHPVQGETFTSSFSAGEVDSPSQLLCRRRKWSHRKSDKKLDTPCNSSLLQQRGIEIRHHYLTTICILLSLI